MILPRTHASAIPEWWLVTTDDDAWPTPLATTPWLVGRDALPVFWAGLFDFAALDDTKYIYGGNHVHFPRARAARGEAVARGRGKTAFYAQHFGEEIAAAYGAFLAAVERAPGSHVHALLGRAPTAGPFGHALLRGETALPMDVAAIELGDPTATRACVARVAGDRSATGAYTVSPRFTGVPGEESKDSRER